MNFNKEDDVGEKIKEGSQSFLPAVTKKQKQKSSYLQKNGRKDWVEFTLSLLWALALMVGTKYRFALTTKARRAVNNLKFIWADSDRAFFIRKNFCILFLPWTLKFSRVSIQNK